MSVTPRRRVGPRSVVPTAAVKSPCGVRTSTTASGTSSSFAVASTVARSAARSIVFTGDEPLVVAGADAVDGDEAVVEQPAINETHADRQPSHQDRPTSSREPAPSDTRPHFLLRSAG